MDPLDVEALHLHCRNRDITFTPKAWECLTARRVENQKGAIFFRMTPFCLTDYTFCTPAHMKLHLVNIIQRHIYIGGFCLASLVNVRIQSPDGCRMALEGQGQILG